MEKAVELTNNYKTIMGKYDMDTPLRLSHFWAQCFHESGLKPIQENLYYSENGLMTIFKKYFPTKSSAVGFVKDPRKIANKVYANRMGNGDEASGDGYKYSGKGFIQITGKANYEALSKDINIDYVTYPEKLLTEPNALISALWFWNKHNLNAYADKDDIVSITKVINGGQTGILDRKRLLVKYKEIFKEI